MVFELASVLGSIKAKPLAPSLPPQQHSLPGALSRGSPSGARCACSLDPACGSEVREGAAFNKKAKQKGAPMLHIYPVVLELIHQLRSVVAVIETRFWPRGFGRLSARWYGWLSARREAGWEGFAFFANPSHCSIRPKSAAAQQGKETAEESVCAAVVARRTSRGVDRSKAQRPTSVGCRQRR